MSEEKTNNSRVVKDYEEILNSGKLNLLPKNNPNLNIKALSNPRFLGSYHLKETSDPRFKPFSNLLKGELEVKYAKALRNTIVNPVTIGLLVSAVIFNILWFFVF